MICGRNERPEKQVILRKTLTKSFKNISKKSQKIPFQGHHSKFEFLECCLKYADDPPGGGASPPPWGILAFSRNREIRILSDGLGKVFFLEFLEIFLKLLVRGYRGFNGPEAGVVFPGWADSGVQGVQPSRGGGRVSKVG